MKLKRWLSSGSDRSQSVLERLWVDAEQYGCVRVFSAKMSSAFGPRMRKYHVTITFDAIPGVHLEVSGRYFTSIHAALADALVKAEEVAKAGDRGARIL